MGVDTTLETDVFNGESGHAAKHNAVNAQVNWLTEQLLGLDVPGQIQDAVDDLVAGAPGALDTLKELADQLGADESAASAITTLVNAIRNLTDSTFSGNLAAAFATALAAYVPRGANIVTDGSFESGDYSALTDRFSVVTGNAHAGTKSLRVVVGSGASQLYAFASSAVTAGQVWRVKGWYKTSSDLAGEAKIRLADSTNAPKGSYYFIRSSTDWREIDFQYVVPDGFSGPLTFQIHGFHSAGTVWVDELDVRLVDLALADAAYAINTDLLAAGQPAIAQASRILRSSDAERYTLTSDGRSKTVLMNGDSATEQPNASFSVSGCTVADDTTRKFPGKTQSKRVTITGAGTSYWYRDPVFPTPAADPLVFPAASCVGLLVRPDDPTKLTSLEVEISVVAGGEKWTRATNAAEMVAAGYAMKDGWVYFPFRATASTITNWGSVERLRVIATATAATAYNVQEVWVESPKKAQILFIEDRGYRTFVNSGLPDLRSRGINITWSLDPLTHGLFAGTKNEVITDADVATFYAAGDDISIHAYDGAVTSDMSAPRLLWDHLSAAKWLADRGYTRGSRWRAAFTQNLAAQSAVVQPYVAAHATPTDNSGVDVWPFFNKYNVLRYGLQGRTTGAIDTIFTQLDKTHGLLVAYTHGIHTDGLTNGGADMTPTEWAYFLSKVDTALAAGTLEFVTFSQLLARSGGVLRA